MFYIDKIVFDKIYTNVYTNKKIYQEIQFITAEPTSPDNVC